MALHDTVAVPDPVTLLGDITPQLNPDGTVSVSETVPLKWLMDDTVIVDEAEAPALTGPGWLALIVKSTTWTVTSTVWVRLPLVLVTVAV